MSLSSAELLTKDKDSPLLKKLDAVVLVVDLFQVVAAKVVKGEVKHTSTAKSVDQEENAKNALQLLRKNGGRLPSSLIVISHEAVLTTVPVTFTAETSWVDANQALVWQLGELLSDLFPTPKTAQVIDTTSFLEGEDLIKWKKFRASNPEIGNIEQALISLDLATEKQLDKIHKRLEYIAPQSLEQLHLGWRQMSGEETAVIAIRKELRKKWLEFGKKSKLSLKAILPLAMPGEEEMKGGAGHFTLITPAKVSSYYFEKSILQEVRDYPRSNPLLPEKWVLSLNNPGEQKQRIFCSKQDAALLSRYLPEDIEITEPLILSGEKRTQQLVDNALHYAELPPAERSLPFISPLEPLPPMSKRRLPYYGGAAAVALLLAGLIIKPAIDEKSSLEAQVAGSELTLANKASTLSNLRRDASEAKAIKDETAKLERLLDASSFTDEPEVVDFGAFGTAEHHRNLATRFSSSVNDSLAIDRYESSSTGELKIQGTATGIPNLQAFAVPFMESFSLLKMPPHVVDFRFDEPNFNYKFTIAPK